MKPAGVVDRMGSNDLCAMISSLKALESLSLVNLAILKLNEMNRVVYSDDPFPSHRKKSPEITPVLPYSPLIEIGRYSWRRSSFLFLLSLSSTRAGLE